MGNIKEVGKNVADGLIYNAPSVLRGAALTALLGVSFAGMSNYSDKEKAAGNAIVVKPEQFDSFVVEASKYQPNQQIFLSGVKVVQENQGTVKTSEGKPRNYKVYEVTSNAGGKAKIQLYDFNPSHTETYYGQRRVFSNAALRTYVITGNNPAFEGQGVPQDGVYMTLDTLVAVDSGSDK